MAEPKLDRGVVDSILKRYNHNNGLPHYAGIISDYGFHIIPSKIRDRKGKTAIATSLLDTIIDVAAEYRTPSESIEALCKAVSKRSGTRMVFSCPVLNYSLDDLYDGGRSPMIKWGAAGMSARNGLISLMEKSATSLTWRLNCQPKEKTEAEFCVLNIEPIWVEAEGAQSTNGKQVLLYDRCRNCTRVQKTLQLPPQ